MSETWGSREDLVEVMGDVGAVILCAQCGGRKCFVPLKAGGFLLDLLGPRRAELLCSAFGGMHIIVPNLRRGGPFKERIISRLEAGEKPDAIAEALSVTTRYVRRLKKQLREKPEPQRQYRLF